MSTVNQIQNPTLLDLARVTDPNGQISAVVEILNGVNEVLQDMTWVEGNLPTGNRSSIRTGIPQPTWRRLYGGVQPNKSTTIPVTDNTGMLEAYAEVDKALADLNGNTAAFRLSENKPHIEGMMQTMATTLFYGNEGTQPEAFTGLAPRFNLSTAANGENIIKGGGSGATNQSIWLVVWSPETVHGIIPKGSKAGLQVTDKGQVTLENATAATAGSGRMEAYRTHYRWDAGLTVRDWRYVVRIPNIDTTLLSVSLATGANLPDLMYQALEQIPNLSAGRPVFYMSRAIRSMVRRQASAGTKGSTLAIENVGGQMITSFQGVPMRRVDALAAAEATVS